MEIGDFFGNVHIAKKAQVKFVMDWYSRLLTEDVNSWRAA
jgi:hypothetical protein